MNRTFLRFGGFIMSWITVLMLVVLVLWRIQIVELSALEAATSGLVVFFGIFCSSALLSLGLGGDE